MERYEFNDGGTNKFWEVEVHDSTLTVRYGKLGTAGQSKEKSFANNELAQKERDKLVKEKTGKGYVAVSANPAPRAATPTAASADAMPAEDAQLLEQVTAAFLAVVQSNLANAVDLKPVRAKAVKETFEPLAKLWPRGDTEHWMQVALELPSDHVLHRAAAEIVARGVLPFHPWVTINAEAQPARYIDAVVPSRVLPVVYAVEQEVPVVSVWSIETGAHLEDLALPIKKGTDSRLLREQSDGSLRCLSWTSGGSALFERKPGGKFTPLRCAAEAELSKTFVPMYDADLTTVVRGDTEFDDWNGERPWSLIVFRPDQNETTKMPAPFSRASSWLWRGDSIIVDGYDVAEDGTTTSFLAVVDVKKLVSKRIPLPVATRGDLRWFDEARGIAALEIVSEPWGEFLTIDLDAGTCTAAAKSERLPSGRSSPPSLRDGTAYARYFLHRDATEPRLGLHQASQRYFVGANMLAGVRLTPRVIVPYGAKFETPTSVSSGPEPLAWAKPGTRLVYEIVDYDSSDTWTFEVLEADEELVLRVRTTPAGTDEEIEVAASLRLANAAVEKATTPISFSQRHADVDVNVPQKDRIAPILVSRAQYRQLASGKGTAWKSEWTDAGKLIGQSATGPLLVDGKDTVVATLECTSEETGTNVVLLADPRWPLLITRDEGECSIQLVAIQRG